MTVSATPPDDEVRAQPSTATATTSGKKKRPILWMVITGIAVVAAIGLGIWAVTVYSDLQDQKDATQAAEASNAVSAAQDEASKLRAELEQARAERDLARAERQQARICSRGSLGVIQGLGKSDEQAAQEMQTVSSACAASVSG